MLGKTRGSLKSKNCWLCCRKWACHKHPMVWMIPQGAVLLDMDGEKEGDPYQDVDVLVQPLDPPHLASPSTPMACKVEFDGRNNGPCAILVASVSPRLLQMIAAPFYNLGCSLKWLEKHAHLHMYIASYLNLIVHDVLLDAGFSS